MQVLYQEKEILLLLDLPNYLLEFLKFLPIFLPLQQRITIHFTLYLQYRMSVSTSSTPGVNSIISNSKRPLDSDFYQRLYFR